MDKELSVTGDGVQQDEKEARRKRLDDRLREDAERRMKYWAEHPEETPSALQAIDAKVPMRSA